MVFFLSLYLFSFLGFFIHLAMIKQPSRTSAKIVELLLLYQLVFSVGMTSLFAFIGLTFIPDEIATYLNWPACPFQQEIANVNLAFGILGILCIWLRGLFWIATILNFSIWIFSDGVHHIFDVLWNQNYSPGNLGVPLYTDLLVPAFLIILMYFYWRDSFKFNQ